MDAAIRLRTTDAREAGHRYWRRSYRALAALLLLVASSAELIAQTWSLGRYDMLDGFSARPLTVAVPAAGARSIRFVRGVGGVAFGAVVTPDASIAGEPVDLTYDALAPDGERLRVRVGSISYRVSLPDWQLVPIARFAQSDEGSIVSLFGPEQDSLFFHAVYHEAFRNTLAGLRLLQADMLLIDLAEFWQLPYVDGRIVLGRGESPPSAVAAMLVADSISAVMARAVVHSWVLTDQDVDVRMRVEAGQLVLSGEPYYYLWRLDARTRGLADTLQAIEQYATEQGNTALAGAASRLLDSLSTTRVEPATTRLRARSQYLQQYNPAVYNTARNTMQYAALFRYVRRTNPSAWREFHARVSAVYVTPRVKTPTQIPRASYVAQRTSRQ